MNCLGTWTLRVMSYEDQGDDDSKRQLQCLGKDPLTETLQPVEPYIQNPNP